jgi:nickel transport protein
MKWLVLAMALLIAPQVVFAHDVWLTLDGDAANRRVIVNYGHPDDRPPASVDKVLDLVAIDADKTTSLLSALSAAEANGHQVAA